MNRKEQRVLSAREDYRSLRGSYTAIDALKRRDAQVEIDRRAERVRQARINLAGVVHLDATGILPWGSSIS